MSMAMGTSEQHLPAILENMPNSNQPLTHHISSSSAIGTMIPTPGMPQGGCANLVVSCSSDSSIITTVGAGMVPRTTVGSGTLLPTANGSAGLKRNPSLNAVNGPGLNGYQTANAAVGSGGGNSIISSIGMVQQSSQMIPTPGLSSQMIPTPGFNNSVPLMSSDCSNGGAFSRAQTTTVSNQQRQKQYIANQNRRVLHSLGGPIGAGMRSNIQHKPSLYGFPNGVMVGGLGLVGSNMQLVNGPAVSEGYLSTASYSSSAEQHFDQQHHQPMISTSSSQQMLPITGDGYTSVSENMCGTASSAFSSMNNQNMNSTTLRSKLLLGQHPNLESMQQTAHIKPQILDHSQRMNFQSPQSTREQIMLSQHQMQNFKHLQLQQQSNQHYARIAQNQQPQQRQQHQQLISKTDVLQSSMTPSLEGQLMPDQGLDSHNDLLLPQAAERFDFSELGSRYCRGTSNGEHSKGAELVGLLPQDFPPSFSQGSELLLPPHRQTSGSVNEFSCLFNGPQSDALQHGNWQPQQIQKLQMGDKSSFGQFIVEEFHQRITEQEEAQQSCFSPEGSINGHAAVTKSAALSKSSSGVHCGPGKSTNEQNYYNQRRWILFLLHARRCSATKGACKEVNCITVQKLWIHMQTCNNEKCNYPRCCKSRKLYQHYRVCRAVDCPVCVPVRDFIAANCKTKTCPPADTDCANQVNGSWRTSDDAGADRLTCKLRRLPVETSDDPQSLSKRVKMHHNLPSVVPKREKFSVSGPLVNHSHTFQEGHPQECQQAETAVTIKSEVIEMKPDSSIGFGQQNSPVCSNIIGDDSMNAHAAKPDSESLLQNEVDGCANQETNLAEKEIDQTKIKAEKEGNAAPIDPGSGSKSGKPKIKGVSLTELFTPEQIREHITSLRQWVGQSKAKAEKNQALEHSMSENSCQLCAVEKLTFEPPPIYCTPCGARIKRNAMYYTIGSGDTRHYFCIPCNNEARGDTIEVDGTVFPKARLEKKRNDEETEEWWVQCDKCEAWQHQICALFNGRRNDGGQAEYTCPNCHTEEVEKGERKPLPQNAVLGAIDLPRTILSDHIEQRLFRRLKQERQDRARHLGKTFDEIPGAEGLVVRVVSSVDKKLEVKQRFLEIFREENYATEFPYKSKVILLFQKIEGVEVCLFGMYVQEFGSECQFPNQRRVYLSYLDSVKYFRPEVKTATGEALRTFVYHEILIGYLEYCKKRGFTSCYIWACPPLKGEDYILYCHPEIQKTPKSDKLREWYLSMLRKASKENIVADVTNFYDHFFVSAGECKAKVTAARLPYFDGDYWPGAAEDMINQLRQEEDGRKQQKKGKTKKTITKRQLKAAGQADLSTNASKDALLMQKLGETIFPMKEDFIMVHLQHACTHCCLLMVSGTRWVCNQCKNFQLCDKCHAADQRLEERDRHPINSRDKHILTPVEIKDVPSDTKDKDEIIESEFFDTRQAFLSLCQGNHYQYDTLRRAKHSSMMVLYHLHNPAAPAFVTTCNICQHDIETGQGWRCETCTDFEVCNACYQKDGGVDHPHPLTNNPSIADRDAQNQEAREKRVQQLRKMLDLLVHASQCRSPHCPYPNCRKVKGLFRHGMHCKTRASGGCQMCKKMWYLLQIHSRACKESNCHVPRCKDLKEHMRRLQQQAESRRRAAVMEMMRQRAAEVSGTAE
ncbi:histone acetyltransferase HAC1-like isoform X1 [Phoenix dactylifera]|uniref:histone acetyltransferase n=1 Tax=Phoenix dactylifera TaxID=42345 RepID=A0A8B7CQS8_PHODC|nr:histone acetyltransferase HAC1-like isoform X1 [Phoenix dactylifera]